MLSSELPVKADIIKAVQNQIDAKLILTDNDATAVKC